MIASQVRRVGIAMWICLAFFAIACKGNASDDQEPIETRVNVVSTNSIVGDWVRQVGGERVSVADLVPPGANPHSFQPGARDIAKIAEAELLIYVGLNLEGQWMTEMLTNVDGQTAKVLALGTMVNPIRVGAGHGETSEGGAEVDPHFWMDPARAKVAVATIADHLAVVDSENAALYQANADAYGTELDVLDDWIKKQFDDIPPTKRSLVTTHDSLGYYAERYELRIVGAVIPGVTTERNPSASEMADLIDAIQETGAKAILVEDSVNDRMARRISDETDASVVEGVMVGTLGRPGSGIESYLDMMRQNTDIITEALR